MKFFSSHKFDDLKQNSHHNKKKSFKCTNSEFCKKEKHEKSNSNSKTENLNGSGCRRHHGFGKWKTFNGI